MVLAQTLGGILRYYFTIQLGDIKLKGEHSLLQETKDKMFRSRSYQDVLWPIIGSVKSSENRHSRLMNDL